VAYQLQPNKSGLTPGSLDFICTYSRPLSLSTAPVASTATSINVIYAIGLQSVSGSSNPQEAKIAQHAFAGNGVLNIQRRQGASSDPNNTITQPLGGSLNSGSAQSQLAKMLKDENIYETLVQVHGKPHPFFLFLEFTSPVIHEATKNKSKHAYTNINIFTRYS
jgi:hypothetical protein